jgi:hypothetical protein
MRDDPGPASPLDRLAFAISAVASPFLVLPGFLFLLAVHSAPSVAVALRWSGLAAAGMVGVPLGFILVEMARGRVTDVHVRLREQRRGPFIAAIVGCGVSTALLAMADAADAMVLAASAAVVNGLFFLGVTLRWKISMHPSILTACALMAGALVAPGWYATLATVPVVVWARVRRHRHTWAQGGAAIVVSALITALMLRVYLTMLSGSAA